MKILMVILAFLLLASPVMATTVVMNEDKTAAEITSIDADIAWNDSRLWPDKPRGVQVKYIIFQPGAASDYLALEQDNDAGPDMLPKTAADANDSMIIEPGFCKFVIDYDESTLSSGHKVIIQLGTK